MRWKAVAWDIDGTLVDSEALHHRALVEVSRRYGADLAGLPDTAFQGVHMLDVWSRLRSRFAPSLARDEWLTAIDRFYVERAGELVATAQARETIRALHARGVAQACISNSSRRVVDANLAALGVADAMAFSISLDDVVAGKPDPEPYRLAASRLGIAPRQIVAVEDSATGAASARSAGMFVMRYAPSGERGGEADLWATDLSELVSLWSARV
jgi:HAD superfamily hydrolase (TIGR01509 family)